MQIKRGKIKFGFRDSFSAEPTLSLIIVDWLVNFKKALIEKSDTGFIGCPSAILADFFEHKEIHTDDEIAEGLQKWMDVIDEMIYAFENIEPEYDGGWIEGEDHGKVTGNLRTWHMIPDNQEVYDQYVQEREAHYKRVQQGREWFAKYFDNLWW